MRIKIDEADRVFSRYIRTRDKWTCQRCGRQYEEGSPGLHASHFHGRGKENTRFDPDNVDSIDFGCHNYFHANPLEYVKWKKKQLGDKKFKMMEIRANTLCKKDRKLSLIIAKKLLKDEIEK